MLAVTPEAAATSRPCICRFLRCLRARGRDAEDGRQRAEAARVAAAAAAVERAKQQAELDAHAKLLQKQREECVPALPAPCCRLLA